jgi:hypothetical protein
MVGADTNPGIGLSLVGVPTNKTTTGAAKIPFHLHVFSK